MTVTASEPAHGTILRAIFTNHAPFLEAAAPAAIDAFFFGPERSRSESFSYIATKELAFQDMEAQVGEEMPPRSSKDCWQDASETRSLKFFDH